VRPEIGATDPPIPPGARSRARPRAFVPNGRARLFPLNEPRPRHLEAPGSLGGSFLSKSAPGCLSSDAPPNKQPAACEDRPGNPGPLPKRFLSRPTFLARGGPAAPFFVRCMSPLLALSSLNLPCALKAAIGIGKRTLGHPASLPRHRGGRQGFPQPLPRATRVPTHGPIAACAIASPRPRRRFGRPGSVRYEGSGRDMLGLSLSGS